MNVSSEDLKLLADVGMMAAWQGDAVDARTVFAGIQAGRTESLLPMIGSSIAFLNERRCEEARAVLTSALDQQPDHAVAMALLALTQKLDGFDENSRQLCEEVIANGDDDDSVAIAQMLLHVPAGAGFASA